MRLIRGYTRLEVMSTVDTVFREMSAFENGYSNLKLFEIDEKGSKKLTCTLNNISLRIIMAEK